MIPYQLSAKMQQDPYELGNRIQPNIRIAMKNEQDKIPKKQKLNLTKYSKQLYLCNHVLNNYKILSPRNYDKPI